MVRLRAHYDSRVRAFVPDQAVNLPDGAVVEVLPLEPHGTGAAAAACGISGRELAQRARALVAQGASPFDSGDEAPHLARQLRESGR